MMDSLVVDIDGTLCELTRSGSSYLLAAPKRDIIDKVNQFWLQGVRIILFTARGMRTFGGNIAEIEAYHRPILESWLNINGVCYDELHFGKPWYGKTYYLDDHALTLDQFLGMNPDEHFSDSGCGIGQQTSPN